MRRLALIVPEGRIEDLVDPVFGPAAVPSRHSSG